MVDPYLVTQFKKVQSRLDELNASQLRIEGALLESHRGWKDVPREMALSSARSLPPTSTLAADLFRDGVDVALEFPSATPPPSQRSTRWVRGKSCESLESICTYKFEPHPEFVWLGDEANRRRLQKKQARTWRAMATALDVTAAQEVEEQPFDANPSDSNELVGTMSISPTSFSRANGYIPPWWRQSWLLYPHSKVRLVFDFIGVFSLLYDSLVVPLVLAWEDTYTTSVQTLAWATACFWTVDMLANFFPSHYTERSMETRARTVALRYLKSWFLLDCTVVTCEWVSILLEVVSTGGERGPLLLKFARLLKLGRILRFLAILRAGRFAQGYEYILVVASQIIRPMYIEFGIRISKLVALILWFNHVGACLWHYLDISNDFTSDAGSSPARLVDHPTSTSYLYTIGYYWSVTAMFSGATVTFPENTYENILSVAFIVFGIMFGSSLISTLAALLIEFQLSERENTDRMRTLRLFLQQHSVSVALSVAIQRQVRERMQAERRLSDQDVPALHLISAAMRADLRQALCEPILMHYDVFRATYDVDPKFMEALFTSPAIVIQSYVPGEEVFRSGEQMATARVVIFGLLRYTALETPSQFNAHASMVRQHNWVDEVAIWCQWQTKGLLEVSQPSELLEVSTIELGKVARKSALMSNVMQDISVQFCIALSQEQPANLSDLETGIHMDTVMYALPSADALPRARLVETRSVLNYNALARLRGWHPLLRPWGMSHVEEEVHHGTCMLRSDTTGWTMKVVQILVVHLQRDDDVVCVKLKKKSAHHMVTLPAARDSGFDINLPATKIRTGELPRQAWERFLRKELSEYQTLCQVKSFNTVVVDKQTWTQKVRSRYITIEYYVKVGRAVAASSLEDTGTAATIVEPEVLAAMLDGRGRRKPRHASKSSADVSEQPPSRERGPLSRQSSYGTQRSESRDSEGLGGSKTTAKGRYAWMTAGMLEQHVRRGATWETLSRARSASIVEGLKAAEDDDDRDNDDDSTTQDPDVAREAVLTEEGFVQMRPLGSLATNGDRFSSTGRSSIDPLEC
mmetsp:Transcript_36737/g.84566  ORF Transcript_36737/g.84566 Transcript_36737/m.84566 type:complete len:1038 (+) Transcript_36737:45-3158(+)